MTSKNCNVIVKDEVNWDSIFPKLKESNVCDVLSFPPGFWVDVLISLCQFSYFPYFGLQD